MNLLAAGFLAGAGLLALVDWAAVASGSRQLETASKPAVILALLVAAVALNPVNGDLRTWFVVGLALSAAGDVALLGPPRLFAAGLAAFLAAHLAYIAGLWEVSGGGDAVTAAVLFVVVADLLLGLPIVRGAARRHGPPLAGAVAAYLAVISTTVVVAAASDLTLARIGAVLLFASDGVLGWNRFVAPIRQGRLLTRIPYQLGQALLVLSLASTG